MSNQLALNTANTEICSVVDQYKSGLITIIEFVNEIAYFKSKVSNIDLSGLTDPNTGLLYPTKQETAEFMAKFDALSHV